MKENIGSGTISGFVSLPGTYLIKITGYHLPNQSGSSTPPFTLTLTVKDNTAENDSDDDGIDNELDTDKSIHEYFSEITDLSSNWYQAWWGIFYIPKSGNWVFHSHLGWLYAHPSAQDSFWLYHGELGWLYISNSHYPFFFRHSTQGWLHYSQESDNYLLWDYSTQTKIL